MLFLGAGPPVFLNNAMGLSGIIFVISGLSKTWLSPVITFCVGKGPDGGGGGGGALKGGGGGGAPPLDMGAGGGGPEGKTCTWGWGRMATCTDGGNAFMF